ncbi:MAG TPA: hypothetical protein VIN39_09450 [Candidatus Dormibacteraeota bacterium]|jgi:hypothetical protein
MTLPTIRALILRRRAQALALALLVPFLAIAPLHLFAPAGAKAHVNTGPVRVGVSFSPRRAAALGLDYQLAFKRLEALHFRVIRLSAYWDQVDQDGYDQLDWLMQEAARSRQPVLLTVGMKGLGWPEFYIPAAVMPVGQQDGMDVALDPALRDAAMVFVENTVFRYRENTALVAWQVENEPFNRAGQHRLWIGAEFLSQEITTVRQLDENRRPLIVNAFSHFNLVFDQASSRHPFDVRELLGFQADSAERDSLAVLDKGDILGLDVYTAIGYRFLGQNRLSRADADWPDRLDQLRDIAQAQHKQAWITEAQAEPWEASKDTFTKPKSTSPQAIRSIFNSLKDAGYTTVLLWGSEYWLWRADHGDRTWLNTVKRILYDEAKAPPLRATRTEKA